MASNVGIKFQTPEEFFLEEEPRPFARTFDPASYLATVVPVQMQSSKSFRLLGVRSTNVLMTNRPSHFHEEKHTRFGHILWKPRLRKVNVLLEPSEATRL